MNVIELAPAREQRETDAWTAYVAARDRAERSGQIADGRAAARAWCAFLDLYMTPAQASFMGATVSPIGRRA